LSDSIVIEGSPMIFFIILPCGRNVKTKIHLDPATRQPHPHFCPDGEYPGAWSSAAIPWHMTGIRHKLFQRNIFTTHLLWTYFGETKVR